MWRQALRRSISRSFGEQASLARFDSEYLPYIVWCWEKQEAKTGCTAVHRCCNESPRNLITVEEGGCPRSSLNFSDDPTI